MTPDTPDTHQKALAVNLDPQVYGSFAEIGAGQEVGRWFFRVGAASDTIAKTISAYDMTFSDAIYGSASRYVSSDRLEGMLHLEFGLLGDRLDAKRGATTRFFAFADTVVARGFQPRSDAHGWMGIRFQHTPRAEPSQIVIHTRLLDTDGLAQQEALGILGVNLVHGALLGPIDPGRLMDSLLDQLSAERIEVDLMRFEGPAFEAIDNRLMSLQLVQRGLTNAAMIAADGQVIQPSDVLYKQPILVVRGSFRPLTRTMTDMVDCALAQFVQEPSVEGEEVVVLLEMTLNNLLHEGGDIDHEDFLARADILGATGRTVLISNYGLYYRLAAYLFGFTKKMIGIAVGVPTLREIFDEKYYEGLPGGILESFGRLFENDLKVYAYPQQDPTTGAVITAGNLSVMPHLRNLYAYLYDNRFIESLRGYDPNLLPVNPSDVLSRIVSGDPTWEAMVPAPVARIIKERGLWGFEEGKT